MTDKPPPSDKPAPPLRTAMMEQFGMRDWNMLAARTGVSATAWQPGQRVTGRYLGQSFAGVVKAARSDAAGLWDLTLRFDGPVDVLASAQFTNIRQQVSTVINAQGESRERTSDGQPIMVLGPE
jgi:hypothetical protein